MNECYICTDKTDYASPCKCGMSVCEPCLDKWVEHNGPVCSICKDELKGYEYVEDVEEEDEIAGIYYRSSNELLKRWIPRFCFFVLCGCFSQVLWALFIDPDIMKDQDYWDPFNPGFWAGGVVWYKTFELIYALLSLCFLHIKGCCCNTYYEDIESGDDDDDDSYDMGV